jgi:pimeloyl-ACP methyl ester carboxylesterase
VTIKEDSMTITRDHDLQLADGRVLRYQIAGTAHGATVFLLHGALGSRLVHDSLSAAASDAGIRLVSYDRPGYGGSTPHPGRTVASAADDVAAIADQLGVDRLAVWGPGGSPFALACAALLPDRVAAAAAVAPLAPYQASTLDWFARHGRWRRPDAPPGRRRTQRVAAGHGAAGRGVDLG